jgi:hypothetical protein
MEVERRNICNEFTGRCQMTALGNRKSQMFSGMAAFKTPKR